MFYKIPEVTGWIYSDLTMLASTMGGPEILIKALQVRGMLVGIGVTIITVLIIGGVIYLIKKQNKKIYINTLEY